MAYKYYEIFHTKLIQNLNGHKSVLNIRENKTKLRQKNINRDKQFENLVNIEQYY